MSFSRRGRPLAEEEKSTDAAKARARAMELLAGQELSSGQLYERLGRKFTQPTAAAVVAEMVERQYVDDERYARTRAHGLLAARKSRRAAAQDLRHIYFQTFVVLGMISRNDDIGREDSIASRWMEISVYGTGNHLVVFK